MFNPILIEPSTKCQINCTVCPVFKPPVDRVPNDEMNLNTAKKIAQHASNNLNTIKVIIGNWSEPFLHYDLIELTKTLKFNGIKIIAINSNFSTSIDIDRLIKEKTIKHINVSLSGITDEVYHKYHRKGNLSLVLDNIKKVKQNSKISLIVKWHRFKHNDHQLEEATQLFKSLRVRFHPYYAHMGCIEHTVSYLRDKEELSESKLEFINNSVFTDKVEEMCRINTSINQIPCKQKSFTTIHSDGHILYCCALYSSYLHKSKKPIFEMSKKEIEQFKNSYLEHCNDCIKLGVCGYFNNPKREEYYRGLNV